MSSTDLKHGVTPLPPSRFERWLTTTTFFLLGMSSVFPWNNILYVMPYIADQYLDKWDSGNSLLGVYQLGKLVVQIILLFINAVSGWFLYLGLIVGCLFCGVLGPCVFYGTVTQRILLLHAACFVFGAGAGLLQGTGVFVAAILPNNQISMFSFGQGFATIFSVAIICLLCSTVLDLEDKQGVAALTNISVAFSAVGGLLCMLLLYITLRQPAAKKAIALVNAEGLQQAPKPVPVTDEEAGTKVMEMEDMKGRDELTKERNIDSDVMTHKNNDTVNVNTNDNTGKKEGRIKTKLKLLYKVLKLARVEFLSAFFLFFVTCNLFPRVGPLKWNIVNPPKNYRAYLLAASPVGDTIGRLLCTIAPKFSFLKKIIFFPSKYLPYIVLARVVMYVPFFLSKNLHDNSYFNSFPVLALQLMLLTGTHGWIVTVAVVYSFLKVPDVKDKGQVGPINVLCLIVGIVSGVYLALLYK